MSKTETDRPLQSWLWRGIWLIVILVPFHATLTAWYASNFGHFDLIRIWKELLLIPIGCGALWVACKDKQLRTVFGNRVVALITAYTILHFLLVVLSLAKHNVTGTAVIYGLLSNLRFLAVFVICMLLGGKSVRSDSWRKFILIPAAAVIFFGLLQQFVLPADWLRHLGYGPATQVAYHTVDQDSNFVRIQSTLRGPNPLGVYVSFVIVVLMSGFIHSVRKKAWWLGALGAAIVVLGGTYSRSAWLGTLAGVGVLIYGGITSKTLRRSLMIGGSIVAIAVTGSVWALKDTSFINNTVFHTEDSSLSESSNAVRRQAMTRATKDIIHEPLGRGPGTAGPASVRNEGHGARFAENYYLQLGQEVGILGMVLFIAICVLIGRDFWRNRQDALSAILLASLVAISVANLLSHAWADDTISLIWWALAGYGYSRAILPHRKA